MLYFKYKQYRKSKYIVNKQAGRKANLYIYFKGQSANKFYNYNSIDDFDSVSRCMMLAIHHREGE